jgi:hypothetical protein
MNSHKHARLTPKGRALLVRRVLELGCSVTAAAEAVGVSHRTGSKWLARFKVEGPAGLLDRSSPEDVGSSSGYMEFAQANRDPTHEEHVAMWRWYGGPFDPAGFDVNAANAAIRKIRI